MSFLQFLTYNDNMGQRAKPSAVSVSQAFFNTAYHVLYILNT